MHPVHDRHLTDIRMRIGEVIGTVTLSRWHPSLDGALFRLAIPLSLDELRRGSPAPASR